MNILPACMVHSGATKQVMWQQLLPAAAASFGFLNICLEMSDAAGWLFRASRRSRSGAITCGRQIAACKHHTTKAL